MKVLSTSLFILFHCSVIFASEISSIPLLLPVDYKREPGFAQNFTSRVAIWAGDTVGVDMGSTIKSKVAPYASDLSKYYPKSGEFDKLIDSSIDEINKTILKGNMTDAKVIAVYAYLGKNLMGKVADRILEVEGVKDPARRQMWVNKVLAPFNSCISAAKNAQYDANHCMDAFTTGLVPNLGSGIVYELSRNNLSSTLPLEEQIAFNQNQVKTYQECLKPFMAKPTSSDVNDCSLIAMKKGVESITDKKLSETIRGAVSAPPVADKIKANVWPGFSECVNRVGSDKNNKTSLPQQFTSCIDNLVQKTGSQIVIDKVETNPALKTTFTSVELRKIGQEKSLQFQKCSEELVTKNIRLNGMINTALCENAITNDLMYLAILKKFNESAKDQVKGTSLDPNAIGLEGKKLLDKC